MTEPEPLLSVRHLTTLFEVNRKTYACALEDVSFDVYPYQTVGLVGESGCGKSTTLLSILRLLPPNARLSGQVFFKGVDLLSLSEQQMRAYRWKELALIFQSAMNALNPVLRVDEQILEAILLHRLMPREQARQRVHELLDLVGIAPQRGRQYPFQFSGGMRQRAMIAMALACSPSLLFADEPTTALDVMIQAQVLELLKDIQKKLGLAIVLVTHDLGVVAELCDQVVVLYGGKVVESGSVDQIYNSPQHPYTQKLLESFPDLHHPSSTLASIPGTPPRLTELPPGCRFEPRCFARFDRCRHEAPPLRQVAEKHYAACHLLEGKSPNAGSI
ncbi:MAG: dipeptide/oligopeptide/nickel ABC transporter ATP-binding protein [Anaerolineae bacterium]|nr:MAG: dipeptide/oligopeptide/nickel ABC transporter ATP-binding protein [Anaerolineae bacterium]